MGRKNRRKQSSYTRKMKSNPKCLIAKSQRASRESELHTEQKASGQQIVPARGDVWFAEFGSHPGTSVQEGCRPAVILSNDTANRYSETVTVVPMTTRMKKEYLPTHVSVSFADCPSLETSMALAEQVTTIGKSALKNHVGRVAEKKIQEIEKAVKVHLGLNIHELG